jgi:hypothetical protein
MKFYFKVRVAMEVTHKELEAMIIILQQIVSQKKVKAQQKTVLPTLARSHLGLSLE